MTDIPIYSEKLQEEIAKFFGYVPASRLSRNLRKLLLSYLSLQKDCHNMDIDDLLLDLQLLFDLLDTAEGEVIVNG
jgi:hypothetical protein